MGAVAELLDVPAVVATIVPEVTGDDGHEVAHAVLRGNYEMRAVERGADVDGDVEMLRGIEPDETVVADGAFVLKSEAQGADGGERLIDALISWSIRNRIVVLVLSAVFVLLGSVAATRVGIDAVPDVTNARCR